MLSTPQGACTVGGNSVLYFKVSDLNNVFSEIISRGVKNEREPQLAAKMPDRELWIGFIRNPDGNLVGLMEKKSRISC